MSSPKRQRSLCPHRAKCRLAPTTVTREPPPSKPAGGQTATARRSPGRAPPPPAPRAAPRRAAPKKTSAARSAPPCPGRRGRPKPAQCPARRAGPPRRGAGRAAGRGAGGRPGAGGGGGGGRGAGGKERPGELLNKLQRSAPYYERNKAKICSFFVKGTCTRGAECPFRHELPKHAVNDPLSNQKLQDRYHGTNDPVAERMLKRAEEMPGLEPPADASVCTLYVGGLGPAVGAAELRAHFAEDGPLLEVRVVEAKHCAFLAFADRRGAEAAAARHAQTGLAVAGQRLRLAWADGPDRRSAGPAPGAGGARGGPGAAPAPPGPPRPPPRAAAPAPYPSMDPLARGGSRP